VPVTPGATGADFEILLQFSLDQAANERVQKRVTTIEDELKKIQGEALKAGKAMNTMATTTTQKTEASNRSIVKLGGELAKLGGRAKQSSTQINQVVDSNISKYKQLEEAAKRARTQAALVSGAAARGAAASGGLLLAGGAVVGGILAEANRFAKEEELAGRATRATREWTQATNELAQARGRVDTVLLRESLPLLKQAARIAGQAASFIERNPELVRAALNAGKLAIALGAVGTLVFKGIKLVADIKYLTAVGTELIAAKLHNQAADKQLIAASKGLITNRADDLRRSLGVNGGGGKMGLLGLLGPLGAILGGGAAYSAIGQKASQFGANLFGTTPQKFWQEMLTYEKQALAVWAYDFGKLFGQETAEKWFRSLRGAAQAATGLRGGASAEAPAGLMSDQNRQIAASFGKWKEDDARLISEATQNRQKIIADAEKEIADATRKYSDQRVSINRQFNKERASIVTSYADDLKKAEVDYAKSRADIIKDAGLEIQRIEEDRQEAFRKTTLEHNDRMEDFAAARNALGLVKEERRFNQERSESERGVTREIAQRRQDIARRLTELAEQYTAERAQRQQQFEQALKVNGERRQEEMKQASEAYQAELKQARESRAQQLRELQETLNAERIRRREVFIAEIRDLDASLLGERGLKQKYYTLMLQDAEKWLAAYRGKLGGTTGSLTNVTGVGVGTKDTGGYAERGLYRMAWNGQREFVLGGSSTRAAEKIIGGNLSQENLLRALSGMGASKQANYYDQRRMQVPLSKDQREMYKRGAMEALQEVLGE